MALSGSKNGFWKGGKTVTQSGYRLIRVGIKHPLSDVRGYAYEHRIVASEKIGRILQSREHVHHIDGNGLNNNPDNLLVCVSAAEHKLNHRKRKDTRLPGEKNIKIKCACGCGETFYKYDKYGRPRKYLHNPNKGKSRYYTNNFDIYCACGCGNIIKKYDTSGRERKFISGHNTEGRWAKLK